MNHFVKNLSSIYAVNAVNGVLGILFIPTAVFYLGSSGYGIYSIYIVLVSFVALLEVGISKNLSRLLALTKDIPIWRNHLQNAISLFFLISFVLIILLPISKYLVQTYLFPMSSEEYERSIGWITVLVVIEYILTVPTVVTQAVCIAEERFQKYSLFTLVSGLYRYGFMYTAVLLFEKPEAVVALIVSRRLIDAFVAAKIMGRLPEGSWRVRLNWSGIREIMSASTLLSIGQLLQTMTVAIGSIFVNRNFGVDMLGIYRTAFDLANKIWFFSNGIGMTVFPRFVKLLSNSQGQTKLFTYFPMIYKVSWAGYLCLSIFGALTAPIILNVMGIHNQIVINLFILLLLGLCINAYSNLSYEFLQASGRYLQSVVLNGVTLCIMVIIYFLTYRHSGVFAIGWAWIISQCIYAVIVELLILSQGKSSNKSRFESVYSKVTFFSINLLVIFVAFQYLPKILLLPAVICLIPLIFRVVKDKRLQSLKEMGQQ